MSAHQLRSKNNALVLLFKTTFRLKENCFLSSAATDGKNIMGMECGRTWASFFKQFLMLCQQKSAKKKYIFVGASWLRVNCLFDIFFLTLQEQFLLVMDKSTKL